MTVLTLLVKVSNALQLKQVDSLLKAEFESLDLDFKVLGASVNRWVQISLSGEDEVIATNYLSREIGTCPVSVKNVEKFSVQKGYISKVDYARNELTVDFGIFEPKIIQAAIPLATLQAQLAVSRKFSLRQISEAYGLQEGLPLSLKLVDFGGSGESLLLAELSAAQLEKISLWQESLLDRLIVLYAGLGDVRMALERARLNRDVIETEKLGLFEHALTCKLGTDAAGLIPKIGRYIRNAIFVVFSPRRIIRVIGETPITS
jgi:hypothetical protein